MHHRGVRILRCEVRARTGIWGCLLRKCEGMFHRGVRILRCGVRARTGIWGCLLRGPERLYLASRPRSSWPRWR